METNVAADVVLPGVAELAVIAVDGGFQSRPVARCPSCDARSRLHHHARGFVPQDLRVPAFHSANATGSKAQHVGTADSDGLDPNLDLSRSGVLDRLVYQSKTARLDQFCDSHLSKAQH